MKPLHAGDVISCNYTIAGVKQKDMVIIIPCLDYRYTIEHLQERARSVIGCEVHKVHDDLIPSKSLTFAASKDDDGGWEARYFYVYDNTFTEGGVYQVVRTVVPRSVVYDSERFI